MKIKRAEKSDAEELSRFFSDQILHGPIDVEMRRSADFFKHYEIQSSDFDVYILRDDHNQLAGMAAIIYRDAYINGVITKIGYCTDLRISPNREAIITWTKHFLPVLKEALENKKCQYFFSVVVPQDSRAYNALVRPRSARRNIPRFYMLGRFELVTILGRFPFASRPLDTIEIIKCGPKDLDELATYLDKKSKERTLSYVYTKDLLEKRIQSWPGLGIEGYFIARDSQGKIVGSVAPWDSFEVQQALIREYHGFANTLRQALKLTSFLGLSQKLPELNKPFNFAYLTHLYADNPDIFYSMIHFSYELIGPTKSLCYAHFVNNLISLPPKGFISTTFPLAVYSLLPPNQPLPDFLRMSRLVAPPDIEIAFL